MLPSLAEVPGAREAWQVRVTLPPLSGFIARGLLVPSSLPVPRLLPASPGALAVTPRTQCRGERELRAGGPATAWLCARREPSPAVPSPPGRAW